MRAFVSRLCEVCWTGEVLTQAGAIVSDKVLRLCYDGSGESEDCELSGYIHCGLAIGKVNA